MKSILLWGLALGLALSIVFVGGMDGGRVIANYAQLRGVVDTPEERNTIQTDFGTLERDRIV